MKILVTPTSLCKQREAKDMKTLRAFAGEDLIWNDLGRPLKDAEVIERLAGCEGYLAGLDDITANVFASCPGLRAISRYGAGVDRLDLNAAKKAGVLVSNTPGVNATAVAELAFGLMLSLARRIPALHADTIQGGWKRNTGMELSGKTLGVLGLGAIGRKVAQFAQGFSMRVLAYDPYLDAAYAQAQGIVPASMEDLIAQADVISLHLPLMESTYHLFDADALARMKPGVLLVNTSRGGIIDEDAAYDALQSGQLGGLGLDAFEVEPPKASRLFALENVVLTPHTGAHTKEAIESMSQLSVENLVSMLRDATCAHLVPGTY